MKRMLLIMTLISLAGVAAAQESEVNQTCLITFYGNPLAEGPCTMTVSDEGLVQIRGDVPENGASYHLIADDNSGRATLIGAGTFVLAAGPFETTATNSGATVNWPNGYAINVKTVIE